MATVRPNPAKPPCVRCGGVWFAKALCRKCYWQDYNKNHPERQRDYNHSLRRGRRHTLAVVKIPRCKNKWCGKLLPVFIDSLGRTKAGECEPCSRFRRGLCYGCGKPLGPKDVRRYNGKPKRWYRCRWHVELGCWAKHAKAVENRKSVAWAERNPEKYRQLQIRAASRKYALERRENLAFKQKRYAAMNGRKKRLIWHTKPCPEQGCTNLMHYTTRPPERCDSCWDRLGQQLKGGDA